MWFFYGIYGVMTLLFGFMVIVGIAVVWMGRKSRKSKKG